MTLPEALRSELITYAGLAALVDGRVYPMRLPQEPTLPAVTYQRIGAPAMQSMSGTAKMVSRYQVTSWAATYAAAQQVDAQVRACLDGFSGMLGDEVWCDSITLLNTVDLDDQEAGRWGVASDFEVWH